MTDSLMNEILEENKQMKKEINNLKQEKIEQREKNGLKKTDKNLFQRIQISQLGDIFWEPGWMAFMHTHQQLNNGSILKSIKFPLVTPIKSTILHLLNPKKSSLQRIITVLAC